MVVQIQDTTVTYLILKTLSFRKSVFLSCYLYFRLPVCAYVCLFDQLSVYKHTYLSRLSVCEYVSFSYWLCVCMHFCLSAGLSVCQSPHRFTCLLTYLPVCLFVFVCAYVRTNQRLYVLISPLLSSSFCLHRLLDPCTHGSSDFTIWDQRVH